MLPFVAASLPMGRSKRASPARQVCLLYFHNKGQEQEAFQRLYMKVTRYMMKCYYLFCCCLFYVIIILLLLFLFPILLIFSFSFLVFLLLFLSLVSFLSSFCSLYPPYLISHSSSLLPPFFFTIIKIFPSLYSSLFTFPPSYFSFIASSSSSLSFTLSSSFSSSLLAILIHLVILLLRQANL